MAQQRRRTQVAPNSIPVAAPPEDDGIDVPAPVVTGIMLEAPEPASAVIPTDTGIVETKEQPQPQRPVVGVPRGIILGQNDPVSIDGLDMGTFIIVKQDVYREVYPRGTKRPSYFLLYTRGQQIPKSTLIKK